MKRFWGIRHIRWFYFTWQVHRWAAAWGGFPNSYDLKVLEQIRRGER